MSEHNTKDRILDCAQALAQSRGFNAYSYADIASEVGIRKASIHHHFASKDALNEALLARYRDGFMSALRRIEGRSAKSTEQLKLYGNLYATTLESQRICLGGMMASDIGALPDNLVPALQRFFREHAEWLGKVLRNGKASGEFDFQDPPDERAKVFLAALQGGLLMANAMKDDTVLHSIQQQLIGELQA